MLAVYLVNIVNVWHSKLLFIGKKQQAIPPYNVFLPSCKNSQWEKVWKLFLIIVFVVELLSPALSLQLGDSFLSSVGTEVKIQRTTLLAGSLLVRFPNPLADVRRGPCLPLCCSQSPFLICTLMCALRANAEILLYWSLLQSVGIKDLTSVLKQIVGCAYICLQLNNIDRGYWSQGVF